MNLKEAFKDEFDSVTIDDVKKNEIMNNVTYNYRRYKKRKNIIMSLIAVIFVAAISTGIVYANESKTLINKLIYSKENNKMNTWTIDGDVYKELNYDAPLDEQLEYSYWNKRYTYSELEDMLNIKLLKSNYIKVDELIQYETEKVDGKISEVWLGATNMTTERNNIWYVLNIKFVTKYYDGEVNYGMSSQDGTVKEYYIDRLDTYGYILSKDEPSDAGHYSNHYMVFLLYDSIYYTCQFDFVITKINTHEEQLKYLYNFLDNLSY